MMLVRYAQRLVTDTFNECIHKTNVLSKKTALKAKLSGIASINNYNQILVALGHCIDDSDPCFKSTIDQHQHVNYDWLTGNTITNTRARLTWLHERLGALEKYNGKLSNNAFILITTVFDQCLKTTTSGAKKTALMDMGHSLYKLNDAQALSKLIAELKRGTPFSNSIDKQTAYIFKTKKTNTRVQMELVVNNLNTLAGPQFEATKNWMSKIASHVTLRQITMPGSHDAGVYDDPTDPANKPEIRNISRMSWGVCHSLSIYNQARAGVRYFDIRIVDSNGIFANGRGELKKWHASHDTTIPKTPWGFGVWGADAHKILDDMMQFLSENPTEVIFYKISDHTKDKEYIEMMMRRLEKYLYTNEDNLANPNTLPTLCLGDVRGKVIVLIENKDTLRGWNLGDATEKFIKNGYFPFKGKKGDEPPTETVTATDGLVIFGGTTGSSNSKMIKGQLRKAAKHASRHDLNNIFFQMSWTRGGLNVDVTKVANDKVGPHTLMKALIGRLKGIQAYIDEAPAETHDDFNEATQADLLLVPPLFNINAYPNFLHMDDSNEETSKLIISLNEHLPGAGAPNEAYAAQCLQRILINGGAE